MKKFGIFAFLLMVAVSVFAAGASVDMAGVSENERLIKTVIVASIVSFWVGALWAHVLTSFKMEEDFSLLFERAKKEDGGLLPSSAKAG